MSEQDRKFDPAKATAFFTGRGHSGWLGLRYSDHGDDWVELELPWREDLLGEPLVRIRTQSTNRQLIEESLGNVSRQLDWRFEVQNAATAMNLVAAGTAITVLPRLTMYQAPHQLVGLSFEDVDLSRSVVAVTRRAVPLSDAAESLLAMIRQRLSEI